MHKIMTEISLFMNVSNLRDAHCSKDPNVGSHIFKLHRELRDDDRDTNDPYPAQRSKRIPQRARRSLAEGQHGVQGEATSGSGHVCRGNRAGWLLKITTWLLLAQHIQLVFQSVGKESVAWQGFSSPLWISLLILWNAMRLIYLPTPFLASLVRSWEAAW